MNQVFIYAPGVSVEVRNNPFLLCGFDYFLARRPRSGRPADAQAILDAVLAGIEGDDLTSGDQQLYSPTGWGTPPANGFFFLNNTFGKGALVNGIDYTSTLTARASQFPNGALIQWQWPDAGSGSGFAYEYPEIIYGGTPYGNPYNSVGPWPQRVVDNKSFVVNYDITLGGNLNSYDVLLDVYVTASPTSVDGSHVAEISFFPHMTDPNNLTGVRAFSWGRGSVFRQGQQILIRPVDAMGNQADILKASIDMREIFTYLVSIGWITGNEYLRGAEFGAEVQVPNSYNSLPHVGLMLVNSLHYDWS